MTDNPEEPAIQSRSRGSAASAWFLQANPKMFDINGALASIDRIWWRVPQYTSEIAPGDIAVIWRSGSKSGIVGVGRVLSEPQNREGHEPTEMPFLLADEEDGPTTRVLLAVTPCEFVSKDQVKALAAFHEHQIVRAPMGTVFPIDADAWNELSPLLPTPPATGDRTRTDLPPSFHWSQRTKSVLPMPGGYDGYLESLRVVCAMVDEERPTSAELSPRLETLLGVKKSGAQQRSSFLRKVGFLRVSAGVVEVGDWTRRWLDTDDDRIPAALLHSRCQFIGEMLETCRTSRTTQELLAVADSEYAMGWDTNTQIHNRRGWLQSCGMIEVTDERQLVTTSAGLELIDELNLEAPADIPKPQRSSEDSESSPGATDVGEPTPPEMPRPTSRTAPRPEEVAVEQNAVDQLTEELRLSCTLSTDPDRFEQAVRAAFEFLGFRAEWLGGSGKTDVLLDAMLGPDSYRVTVDCKTSGSGSVTDHQVDWVTLEEHRAKHDADHIALVAPNPSGGRLHERAEQYGVAVIPSEQLVGLCRQHARTALTLDDYRHLFTAGGAVDTSGVDEQSEIDGELLKLTKEIVTTIRARGETFGRLTARDLYLILSDDWDGADLDRDQIQAVLDTLAGPLLRILVGTPDTGYRVTTSSAASQLRLRLVGTALTSEASGNG